MRRIKFEITRDSHQGGRDFVAEIWNGNKRVAEIDDKKFFLELLQVLRVTIPVHINDPYKLLQPK